MIYDLCSIRFTNNAQSQYYYNIHPETYDATWGGGPQQKQVNVSNISCVISVEEILWPPSELVTEEGKTCRLRLLSKADAVILVYNVSSRKSFEALRDTYLAFVSRPSDECDASLGYGLQNILASASKARTRPWWDHYYQGT
jgi:hypothetical protein